MDCIYNSLNPTAGFKYPNNCGAESQVQCDYAIKWTWRTGKDTLEVTIISKFRDQWNGVGFAYNAGKVCCLSRPRHFMKRPDHSYKESFQYLSFSIFVGE